MFKKIFIFAFLCATPFVVLADDFLIDIKLDKKIYQANDKLEAEVRITNNTPREFKGSLLSSYYPNDVDYFPMPGIETVVIPPSAYVNLNYSLKILEDFRNGNWKYSFALKDDNSDNIISKKIESFEIQGNKNKLEAEFLVCSEDECTSDNEKNIFKKNAPVFFSVDSKINNLNIKATAKNIKTNKEIGINFSQKKADLKFEEPGEYSVDFLVEKEGYFSKKGKKEIYIIDKPIKIEDVSFCNGNLKCEKGENNQNCPQDCSSELDFYNFLKKNKVLIFSIIVITGLILSVIVFRKKNIS